MPLDTSRTQKDFVEGARVVLDEVMMYLPEAVIERVSSWINVLDGVEEHVDKSPTDTP
jgi:hypothetical protein